MDRLKVLVAVLAGFLWSMSPVVISGEQHQPVYDQYTLQTSAESEVDNDLMLVRLQVVHKTRRRATGEQSEHRYAVGT